MHELSIALSLVEVASEEAERRGKARVVAVHLKLGPLSGVVKDALLGAFELAREHSLLAQAQLVISDVPLVARCETCARDVAVQSPQMLCCITCGTPVCAIVSGRELEVTALEIEA